jgi:hypothetical protein
MNKMTIPIFTAISIGLLALLPMIIGQNSEEVIRQAIRRTVDIAFVFFFLSFGASSLNKVLKSSFSKWLLRNRRYLGISFGMAFLSHAFLILFLSIYFPEPLLSELSSSLIYTGILAFSFALLMTATSNDTAIKLLSRKYWSALHTIGGYYLLSMFALTYFTRLEQSYFWPYAFATLLLILLRAYKLIKPIRITHIQDNLNN